MCKEMKLTINDDNNFTCSNDVSVSDISCLEFTPLLPRFNLPGVSEKEIHAMLFDTIDPEMYEQNMINLLELIVWDNIHKNH